MTCGGVAPSWIDMVRLLVISLLAGCSGLMPNQGHVPPVVDTAIAVGGVALIAAGQDAGDREILVAGTALLIAFGISAIHGFEHANPLTPGEP